MSSPTNTENRTLGRPRTIRLRTALLGLLILVCGVVIGSSVTAHILWTRMIERVRDPVHLPLRAARHMTSRLDLSPEQTQRVEEILARRQESLAALREEMAPRMRAELESLRTEIATELTPEQLERFDEIVAEMRGRWLGGPPRGKHGRFGHGPPPPPGR